MTPRARMLLIAFGLGLAGCGASSDRLVVATNWSDRDCRALQDRAGLQTPIRWIRVGADEDPSRVLDRNAPVDVLLGGPASSYLRLITSGHVQAENVKVLASDESSLTASFLAVADRPGEWANLYARLVRGDASLTAPGGSRSDAAAAVLVGTSAEEKANALIDAIGTASTVSVSRSLMFLPDLLHAATVSADRELSKARAAMADAGNPARALSLFTEAPPWPPASVEKMRSRPDRDSLLNLLAGQIAPDPVAREWLLQSWKRPAQPIDGVMLDMLARAADGRLAAEPRFRAWLRSEWTAWCRQRYRRVVARLADARYSPP